MLGQSQRCLDDAIRLLEELKGYRQHYTSGQQPPSGSGATRWQDFRRFISRLDKAIVEQEQVVRDSRQQREAHKKVWLAKRQRLESLTRITDRLKTEEVEAEDRKQQKQLDSLPRRATPFAREDH